MGLSDFIKETLNNFVSADLLYKESLDKFLLEINNDFVKDVDWEPLLDGGSSFLTHNLVLKPNGNYEFEATKFAKILPLFFVLIGLFISMFIIVSILDTFDYSFFPGLIIPTVFITIGIYFYKTFTKPIVFDKQSGYFYKGKPKINYGIIDTSDKNLIPLSSIYSIQIIKEKVHTKNSSYNSYEINLVLKDKKRINVVDHGNLIKIKEQSKILGEYLGIPVWDASIVF